MPDGMSRRTLLATLGTGGLFAVGATQAFRREAQIVGDSISGLASSSGGGNRNQTPSIDSDSLGGELETIHSHLTTAEGHLSLRYEASEREFYTAPTFISASDTLSDREMARYNQETYSESLSEAGRLLDEQPASNDEVAYLNTYMETIQAANRVITTIETLIPKLNTVKQYYHGWGTLIERYHFAGAHNIRTKDGGYADVVNTINNTVDEAKLLWDTNVSPTQSTLTQFSQERIELFFTDVDSLVTLYTIHSSPVDVFIAENDIARDYLSDSYAVPDTEQHEEQINKVRSDSSAEGYTSTLTIMELIEKGVKEVYKAGKTLDILNEDDVIIETDTSTADESESSIDTFTPVSTGGDSQSHSSTLITTSADESSAPLPIQDAAERFNKVSSLFSLASTQSMQKLTVPSDQRSIIQDIHDMQCVYDSVATLFTELADILLLSINTKTTDSQIAAELMDIPELDAHCEYERFSPTINPFVENYLRQ